MFGAVWRRSLFHIVVDTDETAQRVLEVMNREKSGRITFMPLNRLRPKAITYPSGSNETIPLIKKLKFNPIYKAAMEQVRTALPFATVPSPRSLHRAHLIPFAGPTSFPSTRSLRHAPIRFRAHLIASEPVAVRVLTPTQVFGKCLICRDLEVASAFSKSHNLNGITLEGTHYATPPGALAHGGWGGVGLVLFVACARPCAAAPFCASSLTTSPGSSCPNRAHGDVHRRPGEPQGRPHGRLPRPEDVAARGHQDREAGAGRPAAADGGAGDPAGQAGQYVVAVGNPVRAWPVV